MWEQVEYRCEACRNNFVVFHKDQNRNEHCWWCGGKVALTGEVTRIEDDDIVVYQNGVETHRRKRRELCQPYTTDSTLAAAK